jgi:hypothetical protein
LLGCELILKDRNRLSKENALTICEYIIAMKERSTEDSITEEYCTVFGRDIKDCRDYKEVYRHDKETIF